MIYCNFELVEHGKIFIPWVVLFYLIYFFIIRQGLFFLRSKRVIIPCDQSYSQLAEAQQYKEGNCVANKLCYTLISRSSPDDKLLYFDLS